LIKSKNIQQALSGIKIKESQLNIKIQNQIKAKNEEVVKTRHVADKAKILLNSSKHNLETAEAKLKSAKDAVISAEQLVASAKSDLHEKIESQTRLHQKYITALKILDDSSNISDKDLEAIANSKNKLTSEKVEIENIIASLKSNIDKFDSEIVKLKNLQKSNNVDNESNDPNDLFETVEINVPESTESAESVKSSKYGTFTQIAIKEAINKFPDKSKKIIELYHYKNMNADDIMVELNTSKAPITRAINKFNISLNSILNKNLG